MRQIIKFSQQGLRLSLPLLIGISLIMAALYGLYGQASPTYANPIDPPDGSPKLSLSMKTVTPTLADTSGQTLYYQIEVWNTGAYTAVDTTLVDTIPANTCFYAINVG